MQSGIGGISLKFDYFYQKNRKLIDAALLFTLFILYSVAYYRTAWVTEDAFITFRTVDNFLNGFGLTWNPGERVQVYTHPLWLGLLLPTVWVLGDPYWASLLLGYLFVIGTLWLIWRLVEDQRNFLIPVLLFPLVSRAFFDYASSGLENSVLYFLLAAFVHASLNVLDIRRKALVLLGLTSLMFLTRPDSPVLVLPALIFFICQERKSLPTLIFPSLLGAMPAVLWIVFSVFYYGAPVPNTAIAKVATGMDHFQKAMQGWNYLAWTLENDFPTMLIILSGIFSAFFLGNSWARYLAAGLLLWLAYLFFVGADYMGGRFFSFAVPFSVAILLIVSRERAGGQKFAYSLAFLLVCSFNLSFTLFSPAAYQNYLDNDEGIADERGLFYPSLGMQPVLEKGTYRTYPWYRQGQLLQQLPGLYVRCTVGMIGFAAGPKLRWLDPMALTEPFLARLPAREGVRVGHYERALPDGYLESEVSGQNRIADPALAALYSDVQLATRAPLDSAGRLAAIWRLNSGFHAQVRDVHKRNAVGLPGLPPTDQGPFSCFGHPQGMSMSVRIDGPPLQVRPIQFN